MNAAAVRANRKKLLILAALVLLCAAGYLLVEVNFSNPKLFAYAMKLRTPKLIVMLITAFAIGGASIVFQSMGTDAYQNGSIVYLAHPAVGSIALYFAALMCTHLAAFRTARNIRKAAMAHVLTLPLGFFTGNQSGRLRDGRRAAEAQGSSRGRQPASNGMTSPAALAPQGLRRAKRGLFRPL